MIMIRQNNPGGYFDLRLVECRKQIMLKRITPHLPADKGRMLVYRSGKQIISRSLIEMRRMMGWETTRYPFLYKSALFLKAGLSVFVERHCVTLTIAVTPSGEPGLSRHVKAALRAIESPDCPLRYGS